MPAYVIEYYITIKGPTKVEADDLEQAKDQARDLIEDEMPSVQKVGWVDEIEMDGWEWTK